MRLRQLKPHFARPNRGQLRVFAGYCLASALYIVIGVTVTDFLLSFWVGVAYVLVMAWLVPTTLRRVF